MDIVVTGSLAFDQIMVYPAAFADHIMPDKLHAISVSFTLDKLHKNYGGVAGNISYNLGILGDEPICLASLGKDGADYKAYLSKNGVKTDYIKIDPKDYTASFVMFTDVKDCQIAGFYPGAMKNDRNLLIKNILKENKISNREVFAIVAPTDIEAMKSNISFLINNKMRYLFSPAQQTQYLSKQDLINGLEGAEIVIGNDYEIALLEKRTGLSKNKILQKVKVVITTLGEKGSLVEQNGKEEMMIGVANPRKIVDPTGSGDAYLAGFVSAYLKNKSIAECGQYGATAATYCVEKEGSTRHSFSKSLFENRLKENFG